MKFTDIIIMKRINNKIKAKQQTAFITQAHQPLFVRAQKKSKSLNPRTSTKINSNKFPLQNISARISYLNPFSHFQTKTILADQLNEVVSQFKKLSKKNIHQVCMNQPRYINGNCKSSVKNFNSELRQIIKKTKARKELKIIRNDIIEKKRSKTMQQIYDDMENQSANNLIQQSKRQKVYFKIALEKFNHLLRDASAIFIQNWNVNVNPRKIKEVRVNELINKNLVNQNHKDQVYFYEENSSNQHKNKYKFGKEIGMFLKSKDRVMKTQQSQSQITKHIQNSKMLRDSFKYTIKSPEEEEKVDLGSYFSSKRSKRQLLKTSIFNCSQT